jgi:hypothetical protein
VKGPDRFWLDRLFFRKAGAFPLHDQKFIFPVYCGRLMKSTFYTQEDYDGLFAVPIVWSLRWLFIKTGVVIFYLIISMHYRDPCGRCIEWNRFCRPQAYIYRVKDGCVRMWGVGAFLGPS